jgi:hypothetical protein
MRIYVCLCVCMFVCLCVSRHVGAAACRQAKELCMRVYACMCEMCVDTYTCMHIRVYHPELVLMPAGQHEFYMYIYIYIYIYVYIMYIFL